MQAKKIHLIRASQAKPFVETASRLGAPVKSLALESALPFDAVVAEEGVIGEHALWDFVALTSTYLGSEHFGYLTALDHPVDRTGTLGGMAITKIGTLLDILKTFTRDVVRQSDNTSYRLVKKNGETWFTRKIPWKHEAAWITDQYVLAFVIQIVRLCAPGDWLPRRLRIASRKVPASLPSEWCSISVEWDSPTSAILLDDEVLDLLPRFRDEDGALSSQGNNRAVMSIEDLIDRQIWSRHIGLDNLAKELGMSGATLKRRLSKQNTSYKQVLLSRRVHHAKRLIDTSDLSIGRIATALGYTATSNFSRSFYSATGHYPTERRRLTNEAQLTD